MDISQNVLYFQFGSLGFSLGCIVTVLSILAIDRRDAAQHRMHLTAFSARLAWLLFGFILLLAMVLVIIGGK